ncbi:hypothetical protein [Hydrocarboniphaga sp.]|uniref:hypothetical protein n=1 Tax=Hydrocarboniphaga sp. TaxID=2033016 RepID=UPI003D0CF413
MNDYLLLMHNDARQQDPADSAPAWDAYLAMLRATGRFDGGSSIGPGLCVNKSGTAGEISTRLVGYLRVQAEDIVAARALIKGNPVFESGGTVEIRLLPRD